MLEKIVYLNPHYEVRSSILTRENVTYFMANRLLIRRALTMRILMIPTDNEYENLDQNK